MNLFLLIGKLQARIQRALWHRELCATFPTREAYAAQLEKLTHAPAQMIVESATSGYRQGRQDGYSHGYQEGRTEEQARAMKIFKEEHDKEMGDGWVRRFVQ